ncbi:hypothetical protein B296_00044605, partial [Ensete ventricosum]
NPPSPTPSSPSLAHPCSYGSSGLRGDGLAERGDNRGLRKSEGGRQPPVALQAKRAVRT